MFFSRILLSDNPEILYYLKWAGILYIVYLAYDTYTAKISSINSGEQSTKSILSFYKDGFMVAGLSPKAIIFFGTIFSSFINFESNVFSQFIILMLESLKILIDEGWCRVVHHSTENLIIGTLTNPIIAIIEVIFVTCNLSSKIFHDNMYIT